MKRIVAFDLARGFTVFFVPAIHSIMLYSKPEVYTTWLGIPLRCIAEGPGAQLFMVIMGIGFALKQTVSRRSVCCRAAFLLLAGFLLNIFKWVIPYGLGILPVAIQQELELMPGPVAYWQLGGMGDILHFAALALLFLYGLHRWNASARMVASLMLFFLLAAPELWDLSSKRPVTTYILDLFTGHPPQVFFPFVSWIIYPLAGWLMGYQWKTAPARTFPVLAGCGIGCIGMGWIVYDDCLPPSVYGFYRPYAPVSFLHLGIVGLWLVLWRLIEKRLSINGWIVRFLTYSSKHITALYLAQWIVICWLLPVLGYQQLGLFASVLAAIITTFATYGIVFLVHHINILRTKRSSL